MANNKQMIFRVPRTLYLRFKAACAARGFTVRERIILLMKRYTRSGADE